MPGQSTIYSDGNTATLSDSSVTYIGVFIATQCSFLVERTRICLLNVFYVEMPHQTILLHGTSSISLQSSIDPELHVKPIRPAHKTRYMFPIKHACHSMHPFSYDICLLFHTPCFPCNMFAISCTHFYRTCII